MRMSWRSVIGIAISVALLYWTLKDVDPRELWAVLRHSHVGWWVLAVATATSIFPLRAIRWRLILDPVAPGIPLGMLWRSIAIGMMVNNIVPARAGEFARAYALTRETPKVGFAASFASLAVDRVFDAVVLLLLLIVGMFELPAAHDTMVAGQPLSNWVGWGTVIMVALVAALYLVVVFPGRIIGMYEAFSRRVAPRFEARGRDALLTFAAGLSVLRSPRRFALVFFWTVAHWLANALAFWFGFKAIGLSVSLLGAFVVQGLLAIGVAAPSSPGFFGVFEAIARVSLALYGVPEDQAVAWGFGYHILTFIPITLIGLVYFARLDLRFGDIASGTGAADDRAADGSSDATASGGDEAPLAPGPQRPQRPR